MTFDDFELGEILGIGTVGAVYLGRLKSTNQTVAIKILQHSVSQDPLVRARFRREMTILEKLKHPHIIRYFGGGNHDGQLFYAMEAVTGGTVKDLLERFNQLTWTEVASIARQVCSALQHAHNHGIIHRDLKPGNLFLDKEGCIKLGDFGIARDLHSADLTQEGLTVGTHAYMSPEQITGETNISGKADLYSLGCVLFELLTGHKPFQGTNFAVLFEQHLRKPPPPASDFAPDCPPILSDTIKRLMAKDPNDRPFNARSVQGVMNELLAGDIRPYAGGASRSERDGDTKPNTHDVGAATVVDPGMAMLARKLTVREQPQISWQALGVIGLVAFVLVCLAIWAATTNDA